MKKFQVWYRKGSKVHYRTITAKNKAEAMAKLRATGKTPLSAN